MNICRFLRRKKYAKIVVGLWETGSLIGIQLEKYFLDMKYRRGNRD
jgi:hypothetical protein